MRNLVVYYSIDRWGHCFINVQEADGTIISLAVDKKYKSDSGVIPENLYAYHYSKGRKGFCVNLSLANIFVLCEQIREGLLNGSITIDKEPDLQDSSDSELSMMAREMSESNIKWYSENCPWYVNSYNKLRESALKEIDRRKNL